MVAMPTATPTEHLATRIATLQDQTEEGVISQDSKDEIERFVEAYDEDNLLDQPPEGDSHLSKGTLACYVSRLSNAAKDIELADATERDVNRVLQQLKNDDKSKWTIHGYSTAFRTFYGFHDYGPDIEDITRVNTRQGDTVDPEDMLTRDEIHEMLDSCDNPRDKAVFSILLYTGMRNGAIRTLRVGDMNIEDGTWKFNDEADGLKGAERNGKVRPLLGARGPVREWLNYHPASDNPDAYLITGRPKYGKSNPEDPVEGSTIRRILKKITKATDNPELLEKPTNPHAMRHNFVTICRRDYDLPDETIKHLIGHSPTSNVMETTYSHLSDKDHIKRTEEAAGIRESEEDDSILTPTICDVCGNPLDKNAKACPGCGTLFTPDGEAAQQQVDETVYEGKAEAARNGDEKTEEGVDTAKELIENNPGLAAEIVETLMDDDRDSSSASADD